MGNGSHSFYEVEAHRDGEVDLTQSLLFNDAVEKSVEMLGLGCWPVYMRPMKRAEELTQ